MGVTRIAEGFASLLERLKSHFVQKSGDTMTGGLTAPWLSSRTQLPSIYGGAPASPSYSAISSSLDAAGNLFGYVEGYHGSDDFTGPNYVAVRKVNGTDRYVSLLMAIGPTGHRHMGLGADIVEVNGTLSARGDVEVNNLIDFHGGGNWSADYTTRLYAVRNDGELFLQAANGAPMFTCYRGGSPEIFAKMHADVEGGNFGWTAPDGSYNELDSWNNSHSRIYNYYGGGYHALVWQRGKDYNLDYMHGWECIHYHTGGGWVGWSKSDYNEFLVVCRYGGDYNGSILIQRDHIDGTSRQYYLTGGYNGSGTNGRACSFDITDSGINLRRIAIDANVNQNLGGVECWIYARR